MNINTSAKVEGPKPSPPIKKFQTYIPHRNPKWKHHNTIGQAKNAVIHKIGSYYYSANNQHMIIYILNETTGDWDVLYDITPGMKYADLPWNNTPELLEKEAIENRKKVLSSLERTFVRQKDAKRLQEVWNADPSKELEGQLSFDII